MFRLQPRSLKADFSLTLKSSPSSPPAREAPAAFPRLFSGRASEPRRTVFAGRSVEERKKLTVEGATSGFWKGGQPGRESLVGWEEAGPGV